MPSSFRQSWLVVVGWILLALISAAGASYFYLGSKTEYFTKHKLRLLAVMSDQLKDSIEILTQKRLPSAFTKQGETETCSLEAFLDEKHKLNIYLGDDFEVSETQLMPRSSVPTTTTLDLKGSQNKDNVTLRINYEGRSGNCWTTLSGKGSFKFFLANDKETEFDEILVASREGRVFFQKWLSVDPPGMYETRRVTKPSRGDVTVLNLFSLPDLRPGAAKESGGEKPSDAPRESVTKNLESSEIRDVRLAGEPYKLFMQPLRISLYEPGVSNVKDGKFTEDWIVAGLIHADRFQGESLRMSHTLVLIFLVAFALAILSAPFVKVKYLGPRRPLQTTTVIALTFSLLLMSALIGFSVLDIYAYPRLERFLDGHLKSISEQVQQHFNKELTQICAMMSAIGQQDRRRLRSVETNLLTEDEKNRLPYLDPSLYYGSVSWLNKDGQQEKKWTTMDRPTPFFNLLERTYFRNARDGKTWSKLIKNGSSERKVDFWLEPVQSASTGQSEAIAAMPLTDNQSSGPYEVLSVIPNLISVRGTPSKGGPVLPPTFGFMLVENNGSVLFHSSGTYPDQNLIEECDGDRELLAALSGRAQKLMNVVYKGRNHRFYLSPLEGLPWSLVVYRDQEFLSVANLEIIMVSLVLFMIYASVFLWPLSLALFWRTRAFWPRLQPAQGDAQHSIDDEISGKYQALALSCAVLVAFYIYALMHFDLQQLWYTVLALTLFTLGVTYLCLGIPDDVARWRQWIGRLTPAGGVSVLAVWMARYHEWRAPLLVLTISSVAALAALRLPLRAAKLSPRKAYLSAMSGLLLVTSVLPAVAFFSIAYHAEMTRYVRYNQVSFLSSLLSRRDYIERLYRDIKKPDDFVRKRLKSDLDIYGTSLVTNLPLDTDAIKIPLKAVPSTYEPPDCLKQERFQWLLLETRPLYNALAALNHELTRDASGDCGFLWTNVGSLHHSNSQMKLVAQRDDGKAIEVSSDVPGFMAPDGLEWWALLIATAVTGLFLVFLSVEFYCRHVFLLDLDKRLSTRPLRGAKPPMPVDRSVVALGASSLGKTWLSDNIEDIHVVDLSLLLRESVPGQPLQLDLSSRPRRKIVVFENLDYGMTDHEMNCRKVDLIEQALIDNRLVLAMSVVHPMNFRFDIKSADNKRDGETAAHYRDRWAHILSQFSIQYVSVEAAPETLRSLLEKAAARNVPEAVRRALICEVKPAAYLEQIGNEILDAEDVGEFDRRRLLAEVGERANAYYRTLWAASSLDEKFALFDLAQDNFLNLQYPNINSLLRSLLGRGLIRFDPSLRLMNDSFRQFVQDAGQADGLPQALEREGGSTWKTLRWVLLAVVLCVSVLLFFTQRNLFENITVFLGAVVGGTAMFFKLLDIFHAGRTPA